MACVPATRRPLECRRPPCQASRERPRQSPWHWPGSRFSLSNLDGGYTVCFESHTADLDMAPLFRRPPRRPLPVPPRWGYVRRGHDRVPLRRPHRERYRHGDAYYVPPGHTPVHHAGTQLVEFSPTDLLGVGHRRRHVEPGGSRSRDLTSMSTFYKMSYQLGFHPWEDLADHPPFAEHLLALIAREESCEGRRTGGRWTLAAAARSGESSWRDEGGSVTGVDNVQKALDRAEDRIQRGRRGDDSGARRCHPAAGHRTSGRAIGLVLDTGTFHGLDRDAARSRWAAR